MTFDELKAKYAAMTKGTYVPFDTKTGGCHIETIPASEEPKEMRHFVACWIRELDALGFVALHNAFPGLVRLVEAMREALGETPCSCVDVFNAKKELVFCRCKRCDALALVAKPLTEAP